MGTRVISGFQAVSIQVMSLAIMGHFILIKPIILIAGKDGWISYLISIPVGLLYAAILIGLKKRLADFTLMQGISQSTGKVVAFAISFILFGYFAFLAVSTLRALEEFMKISFMPETPLWAFGTSFMFLIWFSLQRNIESIGRMAVILFLSILATGHIVGMNLMQQKDYSRLFPILESGWGPVLQGSFYCVSQWGELILLLMLQTKWSGARHEWKGYAWIVFINVLLGATMVASVIAIFGVSLAEKLDWPVQNAVRQLKFGFVERVDIYGLFTMSAGCFIRIAIFLYCICEFLAFWFSTTYQKVSLPVCVAALLLSLFAFQNHAQLIKAISVFYQYGFLLMALPLLLLLILRVKKKTAVEK